MKFKLMHFVTEILNIDSSHNFVIIQYVSWIPNTSILKLIKSFKRLFQNQHLLNCSWKYHTGMYKIITDGTVVIIDFSFHNGFPDIRVNQSYSYVWRTFCFYVYLSKNPSVKIVVIYTFRMFQNVTYFYSFSI